MRRELHRVLLVDLPRWEAKGWKPCTTLPCGAVGTSPFSAGLGAEVLIERAAPGKLARAAAWVRERACYFMTWLAVRL